jgi:hypothetical protein
MYYKGIVTVLEPFLRLSTEMYPQRVEALTSDPLLFTSRNDLERQGSFELAFKPPGNSYISVVVGQFSLLAKADSSINEGKERSGTPVSCNVH